MREVEGGNRNWLMRILRHEAGHAIDSAYRLRRRRHWREVFGPASLPYPDTYRPRPGSRRFVQHLGAWYAQAHPTEDFAETFAVWLKPNSAWRREYLGWPAFAKLEFIDELAAEIGDAKPKVTDRSRIEDVAEEASTLRQHYERKLARYRMPRRSGADELLLKVFTTAPRSRSAPKAARVLRELRQPLRQQIVRSGAFSEYLVHQVLRLMIERCETLKSLHPGHAPRAHGAIFCGSSRAWPSPTRSANCRGWRCEKNACSGVGACHAGAAGFAARPLGEGDRRMAHRIRRHFASEGGRP